MQRDDRPSPQKLSDRLSSPLIKEANIIMSHVTLSRPTEVQTAAGQYLTDEEAWKLVAQVKARTELLKRKEDNFTLEEQRIRINGERAFNTLVNECSRLIWSLVHRFNFSNRVTSDEMFQLARIAIHRAVNNHKSGKAQNPKSFMGWVFLYIKSKFIDLYREELRYVRRVKAAKDSLKAQFSSNQETPLQLAIERNLGEIVNQEIDSILPERNRFVVKAFYLQDQERKQIGRSIGRSDQVVSELKRNSLNQLSNQPRIKELYQVYTA